MTLTRYEEAMDRLQVTADMRRRVLSHVQSADLKRPERKVLPFRRYLAAAACLAVLVAAGAAVLPRLTEQGEDPTVQVVPDIVAYSSAAELAQATGVPVEDLAELPFPVESVTYTAYWKELAEVTYEGGEQTATYRVSPGTEDNSGIYETYEQTVELTVGDRAVTLKGEEGAYSLALWTDGTCAYSLALSQPLPEADWARILP